MMQLYALHCDSDLTLPRANHQPLNSLLQTDAYHWKLNHSAEGASELADLMICDPDTYV